MTGGGTYLAEQEERSMLIYKKQKNKHYNHMFLFTVWWKQSSLFHSPEICGMTSVDNY